jgi:hypothetical protein
MTISRNLSFLAEGASSAGVLGVTNGGTGVTSSSGASSVVLRDASQNIAVNGVYLSGSSSTLNDYQVNTWTPNQGSGLTVTGTFSSSGSYVKIGNLVFVNFKLNATTSITCINLALLTSNLPYAVASDGIGAFGTMINASATVAYAIQASGTGLYLEGGVSVSATTSLLGSIIYRTT